MGEAGDRGWLLARDLAIRRLGTSGIQMCSCCLLLMISLLLLWLWSCLVVVVVVAEVVGAIVAVDVAGV